jgi:hypothetical protein
MQPMAFISKLFFMFHITYRAGSVTCRIMSAEREFVTGFELPICAMPLDIGHPSARLAKLCLVNFE